jgi:hypothetical protein
MPAAEAEIADLHAALSRLDATLARARALCASGEPIPAAALLAALNDKEET